MVQSDVSAHGIHTLHLTDGVSHRQPVFVSENATSAALQAEDWSLNLEICDIINETDDGPKDATKALKKRIVGNKNFREVMLALTVLETCVKNCGHRFHVYVCSREFVEGVLVRAILPKNNPPMILHDRVLSLIQAWADAFRNTPSLSGVVSVYEDLRRRGLEFPMTDLDSLSPIHTPNRVKLTEHTVLKQKLTSELDLVKGNLTVMTEMLNNVKPGETSASDAELLQMQQRVVELIPNLSEDEMIGELLVINDDLNNAFIRYERFDRLNVPRSNTEEQQESQPLVICGEIPDLCLGPTFWPLMLANAAVVIGRNGVILVLVAKSAVVRGCGTSAAFISLRLTCSDIILAWWGTETGNLIDLSPESPSPNQNTLPAVNQHEPRPASDHTSSSAPEDEEFDMFAQTRCSSLAEQRKRFVFDDNLSRLSSPRAPVNVRYEDPGAVEGLAEALDTRLQVTAGGAESDWVRQSQWIYSEDLAPAPRSSAMDEIERWLSAEMPDVDDSEGVTSEEFDKFLAGRAKAADHLPSMKSSSSAGVGPASPRQAEQEQNLEQIFRL
ncbi:TOM1-like protein 2 [Labeo rohita]|uniref:TOM1-like protein 2 n=1 Tax=Labeo rohita TaxID=84645 RepID=A0ABQ8MJV9_LABRO|nr:TOM1-like protein 2 [Labeo rohita]